MTWWTQVGDHVNAIETAAGAISTAGEAEDIPAMYAACSQYHDGVAGLQGHMPPPDPPFATKLQAALSDYDVSMHFCVEGTNDISPEEMQHALKFLQSGNASMQEASRVLSRDLGRPVEIG